MRIEVSEESAINSGSEFLIAMAVTSSDGQMPGRMVRIHEPNFAQTRFGKALERYCSRPWAMSPTCMCRL